MSGFDFLVAGEPISYTEDEKELHFIGLNGNIQKLKNSLTNKVLLARTYNYDPIHDMVYVEISNYKLKIGAQGCWIRRPTSKNTKTNSSSGREGRVLHITNLNNKINLSRLYCLIKELCLRNISLSQVDKLVLNHKSNRGWAEGITNNNSPLTISDYELVTYSENVMHGKKWNKLAEWGLYTIFSVSDKTFIDCIEMAQSREQFLKLLDAMDLNIKDYLNPEIHKNISK